MYLKVTCKPLNIADDLDRRWRTSVLPDILLMQSLRQGQEPTAGSLTLGPTLPQFECAHEPYGDVGTVHFMIQPVRVRFCILKSSQVMLGCWTGTTL